MPPPLLITTSPPCPTCNKVGRSLLCCINNPDRASCPDCTFILHIFTQNHLHPTPTTSITATPISSTSPKIAASTSEETSTQIDLLQSTFQSLLSTEKRLDTLLPERQAQKKELERLCLQNEGKKERAEGMGYRVVVGRIGRRGKVKGRGKKGGEGESGYN